MQIPSSSFHFPNLQKRKKNKQTKMSSDTLAPETTSFNGGVSRRSANFHPSAWGDYFLSCDSNTTEEDMIMERKVQELKQEVRRKLTAAEKASNKLNLIDEIQRLGLSYHFEAEINEILESLQKTSIKVDGDDVDLHITSLRFRLLRQQGFYISCDIFNKFTNSKGSFKESLAKDERGVLSLYEASHLRIHGENILDQALSFTTSKLKAMAMDSSSPFVKEANYALKWPIYKALPRLMTKHFISIYQNYPSNDNTLLTFAKLDFNFLQKLYQKEMGEISRWWRDLNLIKQLSFARDRAVESYVWALGVYYEPKYSLGRRILAKIVALASVLDDMYDVYATLDELELFTDAIERWDIEGIKLSEYMKVFYKAIFDFYRGIEKDISNNNIPFAIHYAKEAMKRQCRAYFAEAKWFHQGYVPTLEEYMKVAIPSTCYYLFAPISFLGLEVEVASEEAFEWIESDPMLLKATGVIGRLMNDITSHKFEQDRGHVASAVECYMKQHEVSEEEALSELEKQVIKAWIDITEDYMESTSLPNSILMRVLNLARLSDLFYKEEDGYTFTDGATKHFITSMLIDPVPI